ncbi:MAG: hypothetical protein ABUL68_02015 [Pseudomonadota bacterium]
MKPPEKGESRIWALAVAGALATVLATLLLFRSPDIEPPPPQQATSLPALTFRPQSEALGADFYDPMPLFVPTKWNARPNVVPNEKLRESGDESYGAPSEVNAAKLAFPAKAAVPSTPVEALGLWTQEAPFLGMGQSDGRTEPLPERIAQVEVRREGDGRQVFTKTVLGRAAPGSGNWPPMEFIAAIDPAGLVGLPMPVPSPNPADIVAHFQFYLAKELRVGQRLEPGFYRIKVGP